MLLGVSAASGRVATVTTFKPMEFQLKNIPLRLSRFVASASLLAVVWALSFVVYPPSLPNVMKVNDVLAAVPQHDCMLIGSSQWQCPSFFCDTIFHGQKERFDLST